MFCAPADLERKCHELQEQWQMCHLGADVERLVEFAVFMSSFSDFLERQGWSGLLQMSRNLEAQVLASFDKVGTGEIPFPLLTEISSQVQLLSERVAQFVERNTQTTVQRRQSLATDLVASLNAAPQVWFVADTAIHWDALITQLGYFGIQGRVVNLQSIPTDASEPRILLLDGRGLVAQQACEQVQSLRGRFSATKLIAYLGQDDFNAYKNMLRAGADYCFSVDSSTSLVLGKLIDLCSTTAESPYRVLIVEDSPTASKSIQIAIGKGGMTSVAVANPAEVLKGMRQFEPDLVLMDMYMPDCTGVEATRIIRQHAEFLSTPVVYLSGDGDMALQVDALRLGGDHFLTKPFNPVLLNAVVKSKIERYRTLRRSMECDGLTGLFNHRTIKERLNTVMHEASFHAKPVTAVMIDIDHFKTVNDTYGHPAGDQVLRSLAWLLKLRLRATDLAGRYGGEEFLLVLPGVDTLQAYEILDRIRHDFSGIQQAFEGGWFSVTFSAGLSHSRQVDQADVLIKEADAMLYEAKQNGRNCVFPLN
ncbi:MAG: diguanylate cyclase [Betaproteobacteria bacterium]|nr:diguanylate cyclase [Betaproteobacteria bacterium]NCP82602.1 diguanylate cyclase [Rhodoferax sp.]NCS61407.1 diguanylate cyclase [Rhodoferax sp.]